MRNRIASMLGKFHSYLTMHKTGIIRMVSAFVFVSMISVLTVGSAEAANTIKEQDNTIDILINSCFAATEQNLRLTAQINEYEGAIGEFVEQSEQLRKELEELQARVEELEAEKEAERVEYEQLAEKYDYVISRVDDSEITMDDIKFLDETCKTYDINPHVITAMIDVESDYNPNCSMSNSSARGLMQIIRSTGRYIWEDLLGNSDYDHDIAYDVKSNILMGVRYMRYHLDKNNGDLRASLKYYNGGELGDYYATLVYRDAEKVGHTITEVGYV